MTPLDLERMAFRIETLARQSTHDWNPGDDIQLRNLLPESRVERRKLPDPVKLRDMAKRYPLSEEDQGWLNSNWRLWTSLLLEGEGLVHRNHPHNMTRIMRNMARGRFPY